MTLFGWARRLLRSERGNVFVMAALAMPIIIGGAALGVDTMQMALWKRQLQRAADSAALAGAYATVQDKSPASAVTRDLQLNNDVTITGTPQVNSPTTGTYAGNPRAVYVKLNAQRGFSFAKFFTNADQTIVAEATAAAIIQGQYCMVALETGNVTGITFTGSTQVDLGCGVVSNSRSSTAVVAGGSAIIKASPVGAVGGVPASSGYVQPTTLLPYSPKQDDPYASLPRAPSPPPNCQNLQNVRVQPTQNQTILPSPDTGNNYCITGSLDVKGTLNLSPGTYYIDGGQLNLGAQSVLNGSGVTFVLTSSTPGDPSSFADISMNGGAVVNLKSPDSGTYKGVLFYQDPRSPFGVSTINGNSASVIDGGFYFPSRQLAFNGNTGLTTKCIQMVALRLTFSGNSKVENTCDSASGAKAFDAKFVRLVA